MKYRTMRRSHFAVCISFGLVALAVLPLLSSSVSAANKTPVYLDSLASGWEDWSWGGLSKNYNNNDPLHRGSRSLAVTYSGGWSGLQFGRNDAISLNIMDTLRFWVHGGSSGGQQIEVQVGNACASVKKVFQAKAGAWLLVDVPLRDLGFPVGVSFMYWFNPTAGSQPVFYLDDIAFVKKGSSASSPVAGPVLNVDVSTGRHPISPYIYGMNFADESLAAELQLPLNRWGGNSTTRYNWQNDTANHASDWFFENIAKNNDPSKLPNGSAVDRFVQQNRRTGTETLLTVPLIGWTPKDRLSSCGYSVQKYGAQQEVDPWRPDCGNGVRPDGSLITSNDPLDTSIEITPSFVEEWMIHLIQRYGAATEQGVRFYNLDNEPMLWNSTHRDVHPLPASYDEMKESTYAYAAAIKAMDPAAQTCGPVVWGWTAYFWSALDAESGGAWWNHPQDRLAHGNVPFLEWYLQKMRAYERKNGTRILDYLDLHFYPQGDGVTLGNAGDKAVQDLRLRSTRALWDRTYIDESWIDTPVYLIPRMRQWVNKNYPGTKLAITEYNWGGLCHMNGALAQADILGIFGRERLDLAALWAPPTSDEPGAFAFRMYLNYDGQGGKFGDVSVRASSKNQSRLSIYAAQRDGNGDLTLMIINKSDRALTSQVKLSGFVPDGAAKVFVYGTDDLTRIIPQPDLVVTTGGVTATFPATSINLVVIPGSRS